MRNPCETPGETRRSYAGDNCRCVFPLGILRAMLTWLIWDCKGGKIKDRLCVHQRCHQLIWGYSRSCETVALRAALRAAVAIPAHPPGRCELSLWRVSGLRANVDASFPGLGWQVGHAAALPGLAGRHPWCCFGVAEWLFTETSSFGLLTLFPVFHACWVWKKTSTCAKPKSSSRCEK